MRDRQKKKERREREASLLRFSSRSSNFFLFLFVLALRGKNIVRSNGRQTCLDGLKSARQTAGWNNDPRPQMTRDAYLMLSPVPCRVRSACACVLLRRRVHVLRITRRGYEVATQLTEWNTNRALIIELSAARKLRNFYCTLMSLKDMRSSRSPSDAIPL